MDRNFKMVHFIGNSDLAIAVLTKGKLNTGLRLTHLYFKKGFWSHLKFTTKPLSTHIKTSEIMFYSFPKVFATCAYAWNTCPSQLTLQPFGEWTCEEDIGQLALSIGLHGVITPLAVDVIQMKASPGVGHRCHNDNASRSWAFDEVQQQVSQQEVT